MISGVEQQLGAACSFGRQLAHTRQDNARKPHQMLHSTLCVRRRVLQLKSSAGVSLQKLLTCGALQGHSKSFTRIQA